MSKHPHANPYAVNSPEHVEALRRYDAGKTHGTLADGTEWIVCPPFSPSQGWPEVESHLWGAFPVLAIETGGYSDIEAIDPFTRRRFNVAQAWAGETNVYDAMRKLIDAMQEVGFLDTISDAPVSRT